MKFKIIFLFVISRFAFFSEAQAQSFKINVVCEVAGPVMKGELVVPTNSDLVWCQEKSEQSFGYFSKPIILKFNSLVYNIDLAPDILNLHSKSEFGILMNSPSCDMNQFHRITYENGFIVPWIDAIEQHSLFKGYIYLEKLSSGGFTGAIGETRSSTLIHHKCNFRTEQE